MAQRFRYVALGLPADKHDAAFGSGVISLKFSILLLGVIERAGSTVWMLGEHLRLRRQLLHTLKRHLNTPISRFDVDVGIRSAIGFRNLRAIVSVFDLVAAAGLVLFSNLIVLESFLRESQLELLGVTIAMILQFIFSHDLDDVAFRIGIEKPISVFVEYANLLRGIILRPIASQFPVLEQICAFHAAAVAKFPLPVLFSVLLLQFGAFEVHIPFNLVDVVLAIVTRLAPLFDYSPHQLLICLCILIGRLTGVEQILALRHYFRREDVHGGRERRTPRWRIRIRRCSSPLCAATGSRPLATRLYHGCIAKHGLLEKVDDLLKQHARNSVG